MIELGGYIRDIFKLNEENKNFRIFGPDESMSNRLYKVFEAQTPPIGTPRPWDSDEALARATAASWTPCSASICAKAGWKATCSPAAMASLPAYEALHPHRGLHGCQHAKWLKVCNQLSWRQPIASLNFILTSNVWQQDHNGFTHQDPGFLDHIANKKADVVRMYLPPGYQLPALLLRPLHQEQELRQRHCGFQASQLQWLNMDQAVKHCTQGIGIWEWASNDDGEEPDIVMACCGDTPTPGDHGRCHHPA